MTETSYGERVLASIMKQCERRGIPVEEADSVLAFISEAEGKRVVKMDSRELRNLQRRLPAYMLSYLDGQKRRGGPAEETWPEGATDSAIVEAARAGVSLGAVTGTGASGQITKDDVLGYVAEE